jgi:hypothetical protein
MAYQKTKIENATHATFPKKNWLLKLKWVAFLIPSGSLVKYPVFFNLA